jgi:tyrosyl-tRNA synthetase
MENWAGEELNKAKEILAYELTSMVHGKEKADKAVDAARALFSGSVNLDNAPTYNLNKSDIVPPVGNLLIDDSIHILDDWKSKGGIPIFFSKDNSNYDEWGNENNGYAKINSLKNLTQEKILLYRFLMK